VSGGRGAVGRKGEGADLGGDDVELELLPVVVCLVEGLDLGGA
jgi:hypothetical protein